MNVSTIGVEWHNTVHRKLTEATQTAEGVLKIDDPVCVPWDGIEIKKWDTGELVTQTASNPLGKQTAIHHGDLQLALLARAKEISGNIEIRLGTRVVDVDLTSTPNAVILANGERIEGDLIIAADGVKSTIKSKVCPPEAAKAKATGEAAYRFTLPRELLERDEELLGLVQRPWGIRWDGPDAHVVAYPVRGHQLLNLVLIHPDDGHAAESWTTVADKQDVMADFQGWNSTLTKLINLAPPEVPNFRMFLYPPSPVWVKGSTILLGDACHAMLQVFPRRILLQLKCRLLMTRQTLSWTRSSPGGRRCNSHFSHSLGRPREGTVATCPDGI